MAHHASQDQAARYFLGRKHVGVPVDAIHTRAAWRGDDVMAPGDYRYRLSDAEIAEIESGLVVARRAGKPSIERAREDCPLPMLSRRIEEWRCELRDGKGFVVISGVPVTQWSQADAARFFWAFGQYLGTPGLQNPQGDLPGNLCTSYAFADAFKNA